MSAPLRSEQLHHRYSVGEQIFEPPIGAELFDICRAAFGTENERDDRCLYLALMAFRKHATHGQWGKQWVRPEGMPDGVALPAATGDQP
jgi:hypothetical protein